MNEAEGLNENYRLSIKIQGPGISTMYKQKRVPLLV